MCITSPGSRTVGFDTIRLCPIVVVSREGSSFLQTPRRRSCRNEKSPAPSQQRRGLQPKAKLRPRVRAQTLPSSWPGSGPGFHSRLRVPWCCSSRPTCRPWGPCRSSESATPSVQTLEGLLVS
ncbi:unnamed protein product [Ixodes pacificus]